jgi:P27 family predicted phage terminase small subunit
MSAFIDAVCLAAHCSNYAMWRQASEEPESLTVETRAGDLRRHSLIKVIADSASNMVRFSGEFGLTPVARARIAKGIDQPARSKFDGLLARPKE